MYSKINLMMMQALTFADAVIDKTGDAGKAAAKGAADAAESGGGGGNWITIILMYGGILAVMYFLLIRPQRKREKELVEMQSGIQVDDEVITSAGMYGTVVAIWHDSFLIEFGTNKGVSIPIRKVDVMGKKKPEMNAPKVEDKKDKKDKKDD